MTAVQTPANTDKPEKRRQRLAWLDALRGFAAITVVWFHLSPLVLGSGSHLAVMHVIDLGKYGVLLFFLVSGYVIPMSLERHGSLRDFWIGRLLRVYPAYLATIALVGLLSLTGLVAWQSTFRTQTVAAVLGHATMTTEMLGLHGAVRVFWTLAYEMVFYLIVSGLFAWRLHRFSAWWAPALSLAGLIGGRALPDGLFAAHFDGRRLTAVTIAVLLVCSVIAYVGKRLVPVAATVGVGFVFLPALDGHPAPDSTVIASWQALQMLAVMFAGTVAYRAATGAIGRGAAALSLTTVTLSVIMANWIHLPGLGGHRVWPVTAAAVALTFLLAYGLRNRAVPAVLTWLGRISYSLYLLHAVILLFVPKIVPDLADRSPAVRVATAIVYLAVALSLAWASYRVIERPAQALGRKLTATTQSALARTGRGDNRSGCV